MSTADKECLPPTSESLPPATGSNRGTETSQRDSEELLRAIFEGAAIGISVTTLDGRVISANHALAEITGYGRDELCGMVFTEITHPDDVETDWRLFQDIIAGRCGQYQVEKRYLRKDGEFAWVRLTVSLAHDAAGKPKYAIGMVEDITERKSTEQALRESEARFRAIFECAPYGIELADKQGRLTHTNPALQRMLGYSDDELRDIDFTRITHAEDIPAEEQLDDELVSGQRDQYQLEKRHVRKDGSHVWTRLTATLVRNAEGASDFALGMVEDITERKEAEEALAYQALHDSLTDLPNRSLLQDRIEQALHAGRRNNTPVALLLMDLDRFKEINDAFGHHFGDVLLQQLGARLHGVLRGSDTIARLGGDEFALVLPATGREGALRAGQKVMSVLTRPFVVEGYSLQIEASIGVALYPDHSADATTLLRQADVAMYVAKRNGASCEVYAPDCDTNSPVRVALVGDLRQAITNHQLYLMYQPKMDLVSGKIVGVEALARWRHPEHGIIPPDQFIALAERTGLIKPLTIWVLNEAMRECRTWREAGLNLRVAINLSPRTLQDAELIDIVAAALTQWQAQAQWLELEITEGAMMVDAEGTLETLTRLHDMGVTISIDDFGTGYSSLAYLKRLPVDEIKIDKSFILGMAQNEGEAFIAQSVIDLGHNLGMQVVAEGVESQRILELLAAMGCDQAQGYHLGRPSAAADIARALAATGTGRRHRTPANRRVRGAKGRDSRSTGLGLAGE